MPEKIAVIGSGIAGIACAIRLACRGYNVEVYEKNDYPGGKIGEIINNGYRFDTGPSLLTLPELIEELFELANEDISKYLKINKLENICRYFYEDGTIINAFSDANDFANEIVNKTTEKRTNFLDFLSKAKELYELTAKIFIFSPFQKLETFLTPEAKQIARKLNKLDAFVSMHKRNKRSFIDKKLVQLFDRYATYNGSNPYKAPATLKIISHLEHNIGAFVAEKGMRQIIDGLYQLAIRKGVKFIFNTKVDEIAYSNKEIKGITIQEKFIAFDYVISDSDISYVYKNLLSKKKIPARYRRQEDSSSAIIFYWGVNKKFPELDIHNILFSDNYKEEFKCIFNKKMIYNDPTIYIYISSKFKNDDAPINSENWFTMINAPNNVGQDWDDLVKKARISIIEKINKMLKINIEDCIEFETVANPKSIEQTSLSYKGALYGPSSNSKFSAFIRHANFKNNINGLYFVGGSVHPGGGIPLCLASAKIVDELIN